MISHYSNYYYKRVLSFYFLLFLLFFLVLLIIANITSLPSYASDNRNNHGYTFEVYIAPEKEVFATGSNSILVENNDEAYITLEDSLKIPILEETNNLSKKDEITVENNNNSEEDDFYITIVCSPIKNKLFIYNHGKKVNVIKLKGLGFNTYDFIHNLENKYKNDEVDYLKITKHVLDEKRIEKNYKRNYEKIKQEIEKTIRYQVVTRTWDGGGADANWNTALNWSADTVPAATDNVVFDGTSTMVCTINVNTASLTNFNINAGYTGTITQATGVTVTATGNFSQAAGTFTGGNSTVDIDGTFTLSGGTFTSTTGNLQVGDDFTHSGGTFTHNSGTVILDGTAQATLDPNTGVTTFSTLTINKTTTTNPDVTITSGENFIVAGTFTWTDGDIDQGTIDTRAGVSVAATADGHTTTVSDLQLTGTAVATCTLNAGGVLSKITLNNTNATCSTAGTGTVTIQDGLTLSAGTFTGGTQTVDIDGAFTQSAGTFTAPSATLTVAGNWTHTAGGTFTHNSGTVTFDGTGAQTADVATSETFSALTINKTDATVLTVTSGDTLIANGDFTWTNGDIDTGTVAARGTNVTVAATADGHMTTASTLTLDGSGTTTCTLNASGVTSALTLNNAMATCSTAGTGTVTLDSNFTLTTGTFTGGSQTVDLNGNFTQSAGTFTAPSLTLTVSGDWTHTAGGTFTHNSGTVTFDGGAATIDVSTSESFSALTINPATVGSIKTVAASDTLTAAGILTLTEGQVNQATVPSSGTLAARADISQASTFDGGTGTLVIDGTVAQTFTGNATGTLPAVTVNKSSGTATLAGSINLGTSTLTVTTGTLDEGASFNITSGAVSIASGGTLTNSGTGDITLAGNLSNAGTLTLDGNGGGAGSADDIAIRSSVNGTQRTWSGAGTFTVRDVDLKDQAVDSTSPGKVYANSCTNTGNNSRFSFNVPPIPSISMATLNGGPLITTGTTYAASYGETLEITFTATDGDGSLDTVTLSTPTMPGGGTFTANAAANPGTGTYLFSPSANDQGATYTFTVRATDDNGAISLQDLEIMIGGPTNAPPNTIMSQPSSPQPLPTPAIETPKPPIMQPPPTTPPITQPKPTPLPGIGSDTTKPSPGPGVQPSPGATPEEPSMTTQPSSGDVKPKPPKGGKGGKGGKGSKGGKKPKPPKDGKGEKPPKK